MNVATEGLLPRNYLRAALLLLVRESSCHGYDLMVRLKELGIRRVDPGGLYRTLRAMEQEGLMRSTWETSDSGPPRRAYELSEEGTEWLHLWATALQDTGKVIGAYLERYDGLFKTVSEAPLHHP